MMEDAVSKPWAAISYAGAVHIVPVYDTLEHEATDCWCGPRIVIDETGKTIYHNAEDGREE